MVVFAPLFLKVEKVEKIETNFISNTLLHKNKKPLTNL
jgi:hypothetical protein